MHSFIVQIEKNEVDEMNEVTIEEIEDYPGFLNNIADYIDTVELDKSCIPDYLEYLKNTDNGSVILDVEKACEHFRSKYAEAMDLAETISKMQFNDFLGKGVDDIIFSLNEAIEDKYGVYIYSGGDLMPEDRWIRENLPDALDTEFYIGAIYDYHC